MNFRTTWILLVVFVVLVLGYIALKPRPGSGEGEADRTRPFQPSPVSRDLLDDTQKLGELVKVVCQTEDGEEWVFEANEESEATAQREWRMTSPLDVKVTSWQVQRFATQFNNLQYDISYKPGEPGGVTAADAGLDPPWVVLTLTDVDDKTVTVEIGRKASASETYVRLAGSDEICVGKADLKNLIKSKALDYRDQQVWIFDAKDATRVEITDRSDTGEPAHYVFARHDGKWMIESPVTARATSKVDDMVQAISRLRAIKWHDCDPDRLAMYGLEPPRLTITATVEKEVEVEPELEEPEPTESVETGEEEEVQPPKRIETSVYKLHLSDRSPIGEDTKVYMSPGGEPVVGTIMKTVADKLTPNLSEWREMKLTTVNADAATRVELSTPEGEAVLVKSGTAWTFEGGEGRADAATVKGLLAALGKLKAVAFVDGEEGNLAAFGLADPRAELRLTLPGVEGVERFSVGGYTDAQAKRLVYVRRNEASSIAKVRASDVKALLRGPMAYRDHTILDFRAGTIDRIALSVENRFADGRTDVRLERRDDGWTMAAPVEAPVRKDGVDRLAEVVRDLRAESVVAYADDASAFGLDAPAAVVSVTRTPPVEYRFENDDDEHATEVQPPPETVTFSVAQHDGKVYAKRSDSRVVYELARDLFEKFGEEYRVDKVMGFDDQAVIRFVIRSGDTEHVFEKHDDRWVYQAEADFPLDKQKVDNLLLQINDLRTHGYVSHTTPSGDAYGLSSPAHEVTVGFEDGSSRQLRVSARTCDRDPRKGHYATADGAEGVFLLTPDATKRFAVSLDELEVR